jgi:hypothetical protein
MSRSNVSHLLDAMPAMQQLQHLQLEIGTEHVEREYDAPVVERQQCGAFTSSSQLTSLQLSGMQLPNARGNELFPSGCKLPYLRTLEIRGTAYARWRTGGPASQPIGGSADVYSLIECCPNLLELDLVGAVQQGKSLSSLSHLAHLTELTVGGPTMDNICAAAVTEVTGLEKLTVIDPAPYKYKKLNTAARLQQGGGWPALPPWGGMEESSTTLVVGDLAGSVDFRGLRSLMQLRRLKTFVIHRNTFLFQCTRYSSELLL